MRIALPLMFLLLSVLNGVAQFPITRQFELRVGQRRPVLTCMVQDSLGLIWAGSDLGLLRTDGEQVELIMRTDGVGVTALVRRGGMIVAALEDGRLLGCDGVRCDTLLLDTLLVRYPVKAMATQGGQHLMLATYGAGVWVLNRAGMQRLDVAAGLPDDHVNALCRMADGRFVAATDQGLAVIDDDRVVERFGEAQGAPDNLVLAVAADGDHVWAGTDRAGVFRWEPGKAHIEGLRSSAWVDGPVIALAAHHGDLWVGTATRGMLFIERDGGEAIHRQDINSPQEGRAFGLLVDRDGAAWWTHGTDRLLRADPNVLLIPEHEGLDLRAISALAVDAQERIWFATPQGLFRHATAFAEGEKAEQLDLTIEPHAPIVSLSQAEDGTLWGASFGAGAYAIRPSGRVERFMARDGLVNDNLLAVRSAGDAVWFAGLDGIVEWRNGKTFHHRPPGSGFVYDVMPLPGGAVLAATDGSGVVHGTRDGRLQVLQGGPRTCYALVRSADGSIWAAGPGTGICAVESGSVRCSDADQAPFDGDLYGLARLGDQIILLGRTGVAAFDPQTSRWTDLTARTGLEDIEAELNVLDNDARGTLWFACNKGLVRIREALLHSGQSIPTVITGVLVGGEPTPLSEELRTRFDRNTLTLRFTGIHYPDPGALRFEVIVTGRETRQVLTRDREYTLSDLAPGNYRFQVRAFLDGARDRGDSAVLDIMVHPPWWKLPWVIALTALLVLAAVVSILRTRDRRIRQRDALERDKVRFQLEALRSQVDPHFLFNSFNTLVELIASDPEVAIEQVERLSTFFRSILLLRDRDLITLGEEMELLETYAQLEKQRFGTAIGIEVRISPEVQARRVVPLTLQLLVENALKHNSATVDQPLIVDVHVEDNMLVVRNDLRPRLSAPRSTGFGLDSIRKRYASLTDRPMQVNRTGQAFEVRVPLIAPDHERTDR